MLRFWRVTLLVFSYGSRSLLLLACRAGVFYEMNACLTIVCFFLRNERLFNDRLLRPVSFIIQDGGISDYSSLAQDIHRSPRIFIARPAKYACSAGYPSPAKVLAKAILLELWWTVLGCIFGSSAILRTLQPPGHSHQGVFKQGNERELVLYLCSVYSTYHVPARMWTAKTPAETYRTSLKS